MSDLKYKLWNWWPWIKWTPVLIGVSLLALRFLWSEDFNDSETIGEIWLVVAFCSFTFTAMVKTRTYRMVRLSEEDSREARISESPHKIEDAKEALIHARNLDTNTNGYLWIHFLFMSVGIASVTNFFPEDAQDSIAVTALLVGQYILFLIAMRSYLAIIFAWDRPDKDKVSQRK